MTESPRQTPLLAPDVARMAVIEQQLNAMQPRLHELKAQIEAIRDGDDETWLAAREAWRTAGGRAFALRDEWLQLQVVRSFLPFCAMCEQTVGPTWLEVGGHRKPPALCLDCFDGWACDYDPGSGRRPPSHWIELTAQEARERETARRLDQSEQLRRPCWHCDEPVNDLGDAEGAYRGAQVMLKVAALVPSGTSPEMGEVCLLCVDRDIELFGRWAEIERDLCDPTRLRHERVLHRFVRDGLAPERRSRELPASRPVPAPVNQIRPAVRGRAAGR